MLSPKPRLFLLLTLLAATAAIALSACGSDDGDEAASPLDEALGYLPEDAGFALIASTDLDDYENVQKLIDKFPFGDRFKDGRGKTSFSSSGSRDSAEPRWKRKAVSMT